MIDYQRNALIERTCDTKEWDITRKPHTKTKLMLLNAYIDSWFTIWLAQYRKFPAWLGKKMIIIDLFAGTGKYYESNTKRSGSPLIFLEKAYENLRKIEEYNLEIEFYFIEKNKKNFQCLQDNINDFFADKNKTIRNRFKIFIFNKDCHEIYEDILHKLQSTQPYPMFLYIDPYGIKVQNKLIVDFLQCKHKKDILFNFMTMGVQRVKGAVYGNASNPLQLKRTLENFLGEESIDSGDNVYSILKQFSHTTFVDNKFKVIIYDMPYPQKRGILYHLLFATKNEKIIDVAEKLFIKIKKERQPSLFDPEFQKL